MPSSVEHRSENALRKVPVKGQEWLKGAASPLKYVVGQTPKSVLGTFTLLGITMGESLVVFTYGVY